MQNKKFKLHTLFLLTLTFTVFLSPLNAGVFDNTLPIKSNGENSKEAKDSAVLNGKLISLKKTIEKIVPKAYNKKLEELITSKNVHLFDKSFSIKDESITSGSYSAMATFSFNDKAIYTILTNNNIPFTKESLNKYNNLIIPIYFDSSDGTESTTNNPWNNYWIAQKGQDYLSAFIYYTPPNINFLSNKDYVANLQKNLNVSGIYSLYLKDNDNNTYDLTVRNYLTDETFSYTNITFIDAISFAAQEVEDGIKHSSIEVYSRNQTADSFIVHEASFDDWIAIEKILTSKNNNITSKLQVLEINDSEIRISVTHKYTIEELKSNLKNICIHLDEKTMSLYYLSKCVTSS